MTTNPITFGEFCEIYNSIMKCTHCDNNMVLRLSEQTEYFWRCSRYPMCVNTEHYQPLVDRIDIFYESPEKYQEQLMRLDSESYTKHIIDFQVQMTTILPHFITCTWGAHYNTLFISIREYFNDPVLLKCILKSYVRSEYNNTVVGNDGARIYYELFSRLMSIKSIEVRAYLIENFPQYRHQYSYIYN